MSKRIVIIGATSAIAHHCARLWAAEEASDFVLVGRNVHKLEAIAQDLLVRSPESTTYTEICDFTDPSAIASLAEKLRKQGRLDIVLIAHGTLPDQQTCQKNLVVAREAMIVNGLSPALFAEAFAGQMEGQASCSIAVIGSVAGDRGRKSNYIYGAAKGLIERYVQGLQHRLAGSKVNITLVKPGPTDTPMTAHLKETGAKLARTECVAKEIVTGIAQGKSLIYTPWKWSLIMIIVRHIPDFIFKKMDI